MQLSTFRQITSLPTNEESTSLMPVVQDVESLFAEVGLMMAEVKNGGP
jgi:hypothetical protein